MSAIARLRSSFDRARERDFTLRFYERLLRADREIARRFSRTNLSRQRELLTNGVYAIMQYAERSALGKLAIDRLATLHSASGLDVPASMYVVWTETFVETLRLTDPQLDATLEAEWRDALALSVQYMTAAHGRPAPGRR